MKKLLLSMAAIVMVCASASAEGFGWGMKAGLNVSKVSDLPQAKSKAGFTAGVFADYRFMFVGLSADLLYSRQGAAFNNDVTLKSHYLNVPIMASVYVFRGLALKAGIQPSFLLSAKTKDKTGGTTVTQDVKSGFANADFSIPVGVSFEILNLILDARYNIGVTDISKPTLSDAKNRNNYFSLTAGIRF